MKGLGTNDRQLIRLVVSRCEVDMVEIKREYQAKYGESLADAIKVSLLICSYNYYNFLSIFFFRVIVLETIKSVF